MKYQLNEADQKKWTEDALKSIQSIAQQKMNEADSDEPSDDDNQFNPEQFSEL